MGEKAIQTHNAASNIFFSEFTTLKSCLKVSKHSREHPSNIMLTSLAQADTKNASETKGRNANAYLFDASIQIEIKPERYRQNSKPEVYVDRTLNQLFIHSQGLHRYHFVSHE
jgi:hypothetical protein